MLILIRVLLYFSYLFKYQVTSLRKENVYFHSNATAPDPTEIMLVLSWRFSKEE